MHLDTMPDSRPPEYDAEVIVCGDVVFFRRTMALLRRIEQRFGGSAALYRQLDAGAVTIRQMTGIYEELVRGMDGGPSVAEIEAWVFARGVFETGKALQKVIGELAVGSDAMRAYEDRRMAEAEDAGRDPTLPAGRIPHRAFPGPT